MSLSICYLFLTPYGITLLLLQSKTEALMRDYKLHHCTAHAAAMYINHIQICLLALFMSSHQLHNTVIDLHPVNTIKYINYFNTQI